MAGQNPGSPTDFQYFYEDEVYKINNRGQVVFGLVLENFEANSSDQESDIETPIQKGEIRVVWHPSGTERVVSEKTVSTCLVCWWYTYACPMKDRRLPPINKYLSVVGLFMSKYSNLSHCPLCEVE